MAKRWRVLHRKRIRNQQPTVIECRFPWDYDDWPCDDDDYDYERAGDSDCHWCGGDGWIDGYEDDPLWYAPGELERCSSCGGTGRAKDMTIW